jgi:rubrerythrin
MPVRIGILVCSVGLFIVVYYVCLICGNTVEKEPPETCQVCGTDGKLFKRID